MKISVDWLKEYVDLKGITAEQIAEKLTQITCEVEEVFRLVVVWKRLWSVKF